ncbi:MAG: cell wall metabolism sensor histidine kinase WalK, partial [Kosmotoga sp.]
YMQKLEVQGDDEIAELTQEFNTMAERLKAFERINIQKIMEEKNKAEAIVESISDAVLVTDKENKIISLNTAAEKALNVSRHEAMNRHILESIKNEDIFQIINSIYEMGSLHKNSRYKDIEIKEENETKHFRVKAKPIRDENGEISGVVTLLMDITKLKKVDQMKSEFVSTVSHEFRTPLTSIGMSVELLMDQKVGKVNDEQVELLKAIKEDYERLRDLVSDLLDLSKIESGKIQMDIVKCDLKSIVKNAIKPFDRQISEKNAELNANISERISKIKADFNKISWVLTNLIGNALRYIPDDGSGKITVNAKELSNKVLVSVSDNGKGIPEEMQERIFEKFVRADDSETKGTGLGLAISKEILLAHGGDIWVRSKLGEGSTFYFTLYTIS